MVVVMVGLVNMNSVGQVLAKVVAWARRAVGRAEGCRDGCPLGLVGVAEGCRDGCPLGLVGVEEGCRDGCPLGLVGVEEGCPDGCLH